MVSWRSRAPQCELLLFGALALGTFGCATEIAPYTSDADSNSTHALISVERSVPANGSGVERGGAFAGFVRAPSALESKAVMRLVGLTVEYPALGQCRTNAAQQDSGHLPLSYVEFLEAGDIRLQTANSSTQLYARAFPTITDLVSGVVYTTRDRSADSLPAGVHYAVSVTGGGNVPTILLDSPAPRVLENIALSGVPLAEVNSVVTTLPLDLTWNTGDSAADIVIVELSGTDGSAATVCSFRDDVGAASIPAGTIQGLGAGRLALHRVRTSEFTKAGIDRGEVRFDFATRANLTFVR